MTNEADRIENYKARIGPSWQDVELEKLAWIICPFVNDEFDYPRLAMPECEKCTFNEETRQVRGCRHHAQQIALAIKEYQNALTVSKSTAPSGT